ncbi:MAG: methyltransferase domain-containing protein [Acidimicrobiales bacterium]
MTGALDAYAHGHDDSVLRAHGARTVADSARYLVPHLATGARILDVGCGPGSLTADIAAHAPGSIVTGIDASADVVAAADAAHGDVAEFTTGDIHALDFPDGHFDVVHAHQVLQHLERPVAALEEMRRVTRPGGVVAVRDADYGGMTWAPDFAGITEWMRVYQAMTAANGHDANAGRHLLGWVRAAGFVELDTTASVWCYADPVRRRWWSGIWADRILRSSYRNHALDRGLATEHDLEAMASDFLRWAEADDGIFVVPHVEIVARRTGG